MTAMNAIAVDVDLKVMIVDDQATMRRIVRQLLASNGIREVIEAGDGAEALEQLRKPDHAGIDLVICDLMMPVMDGLTFCNHMRRDIRLKSRHVPILLLTAVTDELVLQVARQVGALDIANKPIAASGLGRRIEHLVGMGVLPLQFQGEVTPKTLNLDGSEVFDFVGLSGGLKPRMNVTIRIHRANGATEEIAVTCRIDTLDEIEYFKNSGILPYVLRGLAKGAA